MTRSDTKADLTRRLRERGLRPTRQRLQLAEHLFAGGPRHVCAEALHDEATRAGARVSLATVYNTLHQFTDVGLLREIAVEPGRVYFDTNTDDHHHVYVEDERRLIDIPSESVTVSDLPDAPDGTVVDRVDVIVRVRTV
jgi:Fur family iron response transcriptional regulator